MEKFISLMISLVLCASLTARAQDPETEEGGHEHAVLTDDLVVDHQVISLDGRPGKIHAAVTKAGHEMGREYVLELRADCSGQGAADWKKLEPDLLQRETMCAYREKSLTYDPKKQEVSVVGFSHDSDRYHRDVKKDVVTAEMHCQKKSRTYKVSLKPLCAR